MARKKNPHAVALGRRGGQKGGSKGGKARWEGVSAEDRTALGRRAVQLRWKRARAKKRAKSPRSTKAP